MANDDKNRQQGNPQSNPQPSSELQKLKDELFAAQKRAEAAELKAEELKVALVSANDPSDEHSTGRHLMVPREDYTPTSKKRWPFRVTVPSHDKPGMKDYIEPLDVFCVDESEAIRLFLLRRRDEQNRPLDSIKYRFTVECTDPKRLEALKEAYSGKPKEYMPALT